jgi:hypothetical protein
MAVRWMDGFDHYGNVNDLAANIDNISVPIARNYNSVVGTWYSTPGRYTGRSVYTVNNKNTSQLKKIISSSGVTNFIIGFNILLDTSGTSFLLTNGTINSARGLSIASLMQNTTFKLNNTTIYTVNYTTINNVWMHFEIYMPITPDVGNPAKFYINGVLIGTSTASMLYDGTFTFYNENAATRIDDLYILDDTGSSNNACINSELYIPRIEYLQPASDDISEFTNVGGSTTLTEGFETNTTVAASMVSLGCSNIQYTNYVYNVGSYINSCQRIASNARTGSYSLQMFAASIAPQPYFQFTTTANSFSFWVKNQATALLSITVNGVLVSHTITTTYSQITTTLSDPISIVRININNNSNAFWLDDFSFDYTGKTNPQVVGLNYSNSAKYLQSTTNGNRAQFNMSDLTNINNVKAVQLVSLQSESAPAVTCSSKFLINSAEVGSTKSVTGTLTSTIPYQTEILETNPATSTAWTASAINSIKTGVINKT